MTTNPWPRGAEWRKWDLHVHTPASHNFQGDWNGFIIQLGNADCDVIGINDYFSVAGYREVKRRLDDPGAATEGNKAYRESLEKLRSKMLMPVVECRMTNVLMNKKGTGQRINFHLIFDPAIDPENIETFLKNQRVKDSSIGSRYSDSQFLLDDVSVDFNTMIQALRSDGVFKDRFLIWLPYDEYGGIDGINPSTDKLFKENLIYNADILGSSNKKQADFFLWKETSYTEEQYRGWFRCRKPCIKGSDSHNVNDELGKLKDHNSQPTDKYCWIKADPTFSGLRQIINEPEDRVFIGKLPPKLEGVRANATRYIDRLHITKTPDADTPESWFDCELPLNADMVAIIGNKGSGKSALADVLALAGNTHCDTAHFSFLTKQRFCEKNGRLAKQFEVRPVWKDGTESTASLNARPDTNGVELVRYIPQTYLEKVCTETEPGQQSEFQLELRKVIFSHISDADRLDKETLDELIEYKTEELKGQIESARREVSRINGDLVRLEDKATADHAAQLDAKLKLKQQELKAHQENRPATVEQPGNVSAEHKAAYEAIAEKLAAERTTLNDLDAKIVQQQALQKTLTEKIAIARKLEGKIDNFEAEYARLERETAADLQKLALDFKSIVTLTVDKTVLAKALEALTAQKTVVDTDLAPETATGVTAQKAACLNRINALQDQLDAPNKQYQRYNEDLRLWQEKSQGIEGDAEKADTLKWYEAQLSYIATTLPVDIAALQEQRKAIAVDIHKCVAAIRDVYKELFSSVQELISGSVIIKEGFKLTFESSIVERTFQTEFFERYVSQGNAGSFYQKEKGGAVLEELRADFDFNSADETVSFIERVTQYLQHDMRNPQKPKTGIASQLRKNVAVKELYDFLWTFGYLEPEYSLKLDGKDLSHLSPGERGTLLLVFYLLVDKSNKPIIVDQPEENLDSQTVYRLLIPVIKDVKKRRQIIMVTHSPNIAVVCDAEQIIHAHIDRSARNAVIYTMGAIESPEINRYLVDVLEGTRPAFDNRDSKYFAQ
ncbi:AAA family ATPase [Neorhizobium galegae]|uniref:AAA family ATPase n=1 Tax=Neorhizobium galegae TaxID=399 RepID=A0A6A1TIL2_NEOGA|nr:AAA family ATPase [Neorhizobium galegae]KAB1082567.1 AAA family ATPase [Neorhizobium galegae]